MNNKLKLKLPDNDNIIIENNNLIQKSSASNILYLIYENLNKHEEAFEMQSIYYHLRDSINSAEAQNNSIHQQYKYEYEIRSAQDSINIVSTFMA